MQIETFKVFCDLCDTGSFSKAASMNSITQSAVSQQIRSLEDKFDVILIERGKRNFSVTQEGLAFLDASREIVHCYDSLSDRIHELRHVVAGDLRIATVFSIGLHELPPLLKLFKSRYADVKVKVEYRRSSQVYEEVAEGVADVGLVAFPLKRKGLSVESFFKDRLVLICSPNHSFAERRRISVGELSGEKFISFEPDLPTRKALDRILKNHGVEVQREMEFDNIETVKRAVEIDNGISIVPLTTVQAELKAGTLAAVHIDASNMWRPIGVIQKRNRPRSNALKHFVALLKQQVRLQDKKALGLDGLKGTA